MDCIRLCPLNDYPVHQALKDLGAPHLPHALLSDQFALGSPQLRQALQAKVDPLLAQLQPTLSQKEAAWHQAPADVLALDLAFVSNPDEEIGLAWVEIQAFTSMLPTFNTLWKAHQSLGVVPEGYLPHDPLPVEPSWLDEVRRWVAPHPDTVLIEDRPTERVTWPDLDAARHWWRADVCDWRDLQARDGLLHNPHSGKTYHHAWNRLVLPDLDPDERPLAEKTLYAASGLTWHSHPGWYEQIHKGSLADIQLSHHESCHWVESKDWLREKMENYVLKKVNGHSGSDLLLTPTLSDVLNLPTPRQWIAQKRFQQVPIGHHPSKVPLFGEIRCLLGLKPGQAPWVMAWILRLSQNGIATVLGRHKLPGEGMALIYFEA